MTTSQPDEDAASKPLRCVVCAAELPTGARYCTQCQSHQALGARVFASLNVQSLVALVPIATLAFVFVQDRFGGHGSEIRLSTLSCGRDRIEVAATNVGDRTAILRAITVEMRADGAPTRRLTAVQSAATAGDADSRQLAPQAMRVYGLTPLNPQREVSALPPAPSRGACRYEVVAEVISFDNEPTSAAAHCECPRT